MSTPAAAALSDPGTPPAADPAAPPAAAPAAPSGEAKFWNSWNLPDQKETRDWVANKNYENPFTLAKTAQTLEREAATLRQGKGYPTEVVNPDGTVIKPNAEAIKAWNMLTGVPDAPDKYNIPVPENNPYPQFKTHMAQLFHETGVPAAMATKLATGYEAVVGKMEAELKAAEDQASERGLAELKDSWAGNYNERMSYAARGKEWLSREVGGMNDLQMRVLESVLGTSKFLSAMWKIGAGNREASFPNNSSTSAFSGGASEAQARLDQITALRSENKISQQDFMKESTELANRIAAGFAQPGNA
jgi:hypothetical protein